MALPDTDVVAATADHADLQWKFDAFYQQHCH